MLPLSAVVAVVVVVAAVVVARAQVKSVQPKNGSQAEAAHGAHDKCAT